MKYVPLFAEVFCKCKSILKSNAEDISNMKQEKKAVLKSASS